MFSVLSDFKKVFISFISLSWFKAFILINRIFWLSSSMLWFTRFLSFHSARSGFPIDSLPYRLGNKNSPGVTWGCNCSSLTCLGLKGGGHDQTKTTTKRKSYQVLLYLDSPDVIYSLVYEVFSWPCWLRSTHFVISEHTRPVTWWQCVLNK